VLSAERGMPDRTKELTCTIQKGQDNLALPKMINPTNVVWLAGPALQMVLVFFLVRRRASRTFRAFFGYTLFAIIAEIARFALHGRPFAYFYVYWATEALYAVLGFAALYEVFNRLFRHLYYLRGFKFLFLGVSLLMLALSALWTFLYSQPVHAPPMLAAIFALELAVRWLQTGLLVLIFFLAVYYVEYSQQHAFAIAAGFGVSAAGILGTILVRSEFGTKYPVLLQFLSPVTYLIAIFIWLSAFIRPEPPDHFASLRDLNPRDFVELIRRWKEKSKEKLPPWFDRRYSGSGLK